MQASIEGQSGYLTLERVQKKKTGMDVMIKYFHDVWPLAGLALALAVTVGWISLLGYGLLRLL
jgi:hypothetical protein